MKLGTDCSGIGAPEEALNRLGINYDPVFACEIDKHARASYKAIHKAPQTFYEDLTKRKHEEVERLDLYVAGFPCQAFSIAGKRKGFEDIRGSVFFHVAEFIRVNRPKVFVLENVRGLISHDSGRTFQTIIEVLSGNGTCNGQISIPFYDDGLDYHISWQILNTKEHGVPQNRERVFIVGFEQQRSFSFPKPEPLKTKLKDIIENDVAEKYFLSEETLKQIVKWKSFQNPLIDNLYGQDCEKYINCLTARGDGELHSGMKLIKVKSATKQGFELAQEGDAVNYKFHTIETRRGRVGKQCAQALEAENMQGVINQNTIRRLTPRECWRLQDFSEESFDKAQAVQSDTQLYKQAGNSMTVRVFYKLLKQIYEA
tara:strand:+ start:631 stop:1743 length:1113 start_codon:yes stop_codon:yes gene_type:complete